MVKIGNNLYFEITNRNFPRGVSLWKCSLLSVTANTEIKNETDKACIYPIPSGGQIQIMVPEQFIGGQVVVYDSQGVLVLEEFITGYLSSISLDNVIPGVYVVKISKGNSAVVRKVIKN